MILSNSQIDHVKSEFLQFLKKESKEKVASLSVFDVSACDKILVVIKSKLNVCCQLSEALQSLHKRKAFAESASMHVGEKNDSIVFSGYIDHFKIYDESKNKEEICQIGPTKLEVFFHNLLEANMVTIDMLDEDDAEIIGISRPQQKITFQKNSLGLVNKFVPIGSWCIVANYFQQRNWRTESYPFDWAFSNLEFIIASVRDPTFPLVDFMKPMAEKRVFEKSDIHKVVTFPHQNKECETDVATMVRRCERWKLLFDVNNSDNIKEKPILICEEEAPDVSNSSESSEKKFLLASQSSVVFVHFARNTQKYLAVVKQLKRFCRIMHQRNSELKFQVVSVWHRVWNVNDERRAQKINKLTYLGSPTTTHMNSSIKNKIHIYLARVSNVWDGHNWSGMMQKSILDQIFDQFTYQRTTETQRLSVDELNMSTKEHNLTSAEQNE